MSYATIEDLRSRLAERPVPAESLAYARKMLHRVPDAPVVDRAAFLLEQCRGQRVLEFGASGPMQAQIRAAASAYVGVDREDAPDVIGHDLDDVSLDLPDTRFTQEGEAPPDVIVCGEVLEHLGNPQWFLTRLRRTFPGVRVIVTVPNAFSAIASAHMSKGTENVNADHVAWYSYRTIKTLMARAGYDTLTFAWYRGQPRTAEGLIVVTE